MWVSISMRLESTPVADHCPLSSVREWSMFLMALPLSMGVHFTTTLVPGMLMTEASQASPTVVG